MGDIKMSTIIIDSYMNISYPWKYPVFWIDAVNNPQFKTKITVWHSGDRSNIWYTDSTKSEVKNAIENAIKYLKNEYEDGYWSFSYGGQAKFEKLLRKYGVKNIYAKDWI